MRDKYFAIGSALIVIATLMPDSARADWINLSGAETAPNIAEIYVLDDQVRLVMAMFFAVTMLALSPRRDDQE